MDYKTRNSPDKKLHTSESLLIRTQTSTLASLGNTDMSVISVTFSELNPQTYEAERYLWVTFRRECCVTQSVFGVWNFLT